MRPKVLLTALIFLLPGCAAAPPDGVTGSPVSGGPIAGKNATPAAPALPPTVTPTAYVTVPVDATAAEPPVLVWLRWQKVRVETDTDGDARVYDAAATRHALVQYRRMLRLRMDTIAQNIASSNVTRDARGDANPYRRKEVTIDAKGGVEIKPDPSPFRQVYDPSHPDADSKGTVKLPNVDPAVEYAAALQATREYQLVIGIMQHLDPTVVGEDLKIPALPESAHAPDSPVTSSSR